MLSPIQLDLNYAFAVTSKKNNIINSATTALEYLGLLYSFTVRAKYNTIDACTVQ